MQIRLLIETFSRKGKCRYDKRVSTRSIFDLGVSWESSTAADVLLPKYASSTRKIHPLEVSAHINNRLFVLENTRRVHGCLESIYNKVWFFMQFALFSFSFAAGSFRLNFILLCILLYYLWHFIILYMTFYYSCVLLHYVESYKRNVIKRKKDKNLESERIKLSRGITLFDSQLKRKKSSVRKWN